MSWAQFLANLRGIETSSLRLRFGSPQKFLANLRGIETAGSW